MLVTFTRQEPALTPREVRAIETGLGLLFPPSLRRFYLLANGGIPSPCIFQNEILEAAIAEFLPLKSKQVRDAVEMYRILVLEELLVPKRFFPFAVDRGHDYFFTDTATPEGAVYCYRYETGYEDTQNLHISFEQFWSTMK